MPGLGFFMFVTYQELHVQQAWKKPLRHDNLFFFWMFRVICWRSFLQGTLVWSLSACPYNVNFILSPEKTFTCTQHAVSILASIRTIAEVLVVRASQMPFSAQKKPHPDTFFVLHQPSSIHVGLTQCQWSRASISDVSAGTHTEPELTSFRLSCMFSDKSPWQGLD